MKKGTKENFSLKSNIPETLSQGDALIIDIESNSKEETFYLSFLEKEFVFQHYEKSLFRAIVGIDAFTTPAQYSLTIKNHQETCFQKDIIIYSSDYPLKEISEEAYALREHYMSTTQEETNRVSLLRKTVSTFKPAELRPFAIPTEGNIIVPYGEIHFYKAQSLNKYHIGVDFKAETGTSVFSCCEGKVLLAEFLERRGGMVIIDHGYGVISEYQHLSKITTRQDELISKHFKLGEVGETGQTTHGSILHWSLFVNGISVNPLKWL